MPLITSANIGCGFHAGDAETTFAALQLANQHHVQVGAHPGFPDREAFGRREWDWPPERIHHECLYQAGALESPLAVKYGILVLPNLFLVGKDGKVVSRSVQIGGLEDEVKKLLTEK